MKLRNAAAVAAFFALFLGQEVHATSINLVTNGNFDQTSFTNNSQFGTGYGGQGVTGWTGGSGYQLYFFAGTATTNSAASQYDTGYNTGSEMLWANGFTASPTGGTGNFVVLDGDPTVGGGGSISQTISGLTAGTDYAVTFTWAAGQLQSRTGATTDKLDVSLGGESLITNAVADASQSFTPWVQQTLIFEATGTSETLSFLAEGTPTGLPPVVALDGISMTAVPEPASLALLAAGLGLLGFFYRRRHLS